MLRKSTFFHIFSRRLSRSTGGFLTASPVANRLCRTSVYRTTIGHAPIRDTIIKSHLCSYRGRLQQRGTYPQHNAASRCHSSSAKGFNCSIFNQPLLVAVPPSSHGVWTTAAMLSINVPFIAQTPAVASRRTSRGIQVCADSGVDAFHYTPGTFDFSHDITSRLLSDIIFDLSTKKQCRDDAIPFLPRRYLFVFFISLCTPAVLRHYRASTKCVSPKPSAHAPSLYRFSAVGCI